MRILNRIGKSINGNPLREWLFGFFLIFGGIWLSFAVFNQIEDMYYRTTPASRYFNYRSVEYVRRDGDSLVFASDRVVQSESPMVWNDVLECGNSKYELRYTSNQETKDITPKAFTEYRKVQWDYTKPFPVGRTCVLTSQITMTVHGFAKSQDVVSKPFVIEE